jgi:hypothetical protein
MASSCLDLFIMVYGIYLFISFIVPSIMLNLNVFPGLARIWKEQADRVLVNDAVMLIIVKVLNDLDNKN